jgi:hypothetical protein
MAAVVALVMTTSGRSAPHHQFVVPQLLPNRTSQPELQGMEFRVIRGAAGCSGCVWIRGTGAITADTYLKLRQARASVPDRFNFPVILNSAGGSLAGGLALGREIRSLALSTHLGSFALPSVELGKEGDIVDYSNDICASACAYAFIGGLKRSLGKDAKLGVHQFSQEITGPQLPSNDVQITQDITALLYTYVRDMGISSDFFKVSTETHSENIHWLSLNEADRLQLINSPGPYSSPKWEPSGTFGDRIWLVKYRSSGNHDIFSINCQPKYMPDHKNYTLGVLTAGLKTLPERFFSTQVKKSVRIETDKGETLNLSIYRFAGLMEKTYTIDLQIERGQWRSFVSGAEFIRIAVEPSDDMMDAGIPTDYSFPAINLTAQMDKIDRRCE